MSYSLIIPHKNSSHLLARLLDSVFGISEMQIIVVDDNSRESEKQTLLILQEKYKYQLYNNEGSTAGGARNTGLKYAQGDWVIFADADDYFTSALYDILFKYKNSVADVVFFNVASIISETGVVAHRDAHIKFLFSNYAKKQDANVFRCKYLVPWGKLYKRDFIEENKIRFDECVAGNDMWFAVRSGVEARQIAVDDRELYVCTVSSGSITTILSKERHEAKLQATLRVNNYLRTKRLAHYQTSVLYFIAAAQQFGLKYVFHVLTECCKNRSNLFIGIEKIFHFRKVLEDRQNPNYTKK